jgi:hypothetical protein
MAKNKKTKSSNLLAKINERSILIVLAMVLLVSVAVLIIKDKRGTQIIDPVTVDQKVTE